MIIGVFCLKFLFPYGCGSSPFITPTPMADNYVLAKQNISRIAHAINWSCVRYV